MRDLENFKNTTPENMAAESSRSAARRQPRAVPDPLNTIGVEKLDPFESLAVDGQRLRALLSHREYRIDEDTGWF
jgi:hypothetical protein